MSEFKKGDRVRVAYEGVVTTVYDNPNGLDVRLDGGGAEPYVPSHVLNKVTLLERAKPTLRGGDVVTYAETGGTYLIGRKKVSFAVRDGEAIYVGETPEQLAGRIANNPGKYKINGEVFA